MTTPLVGTPATIHLFSDSRAAVVTRVNEKSIQVRVVATDSKTRRRINDPSEPLPCWAEDGDLRKIIGAPERYRLVGHREDGTPIYRNGSISVTLGRSVQIRDYRV